MEGSDNRTVVTLLVPKHNRWKILLSRWSNTGYKTIGLLHNWFRATPLDRWFFVMSLVAKKPFMVWVFSWVVLVHFFDILRIHTLTIYSGIVEYKILGDTEAALLGSIPFISKVINGDIISTWQYKNYQNFPKLLFKTILKKFIPQHKTRAAGLLWWKNSFEHCWCCKNSTNF